MKKTILSILFLLSLSSLKATHNRSGEILYARIAPFTTVVANVTVPVYTYSITLITYTDDGPGIADRCNDTIYFGDGQRAIANRLNFPNAPGALSNCGCSTGCGNIIVNDVNYKVKKNVYSATHTYAGTGNYVVRFLDPNRNANIVNIPNSVNQPFYIESLVVILSFTGANSSPVPSNPPVDRGYVSSCFYHNPAAYDVDGDSLSYELDSAKAGYNAVVPGYALPATGTNGVLNINTNGLLTWCNPQSVGEYNIVIKIKEWRKPSCGGAYQMIGYITRDMQMLINSGVTPVVTPTPLPDTCIVAGAALTRTFNNTAQTGITGITLYGACAFSSLPAASVHPPRAWAPPHFYGQLIAALRKSKRIMWCWYMIFQAHKATCALIVNLM
jgi:hypothetical protein